MIYLKYNVHVYSRIVDIFLILLVRTQRILLHRCLFLNSEPVYMCDPFVRVFQTDRRNSQSNGQGRKRESGNLYVIILNFIF